MKHNHNADEFMDHHGGAESGGHPCKGPKDRLVQIGEPPVYWKSVDELRNGPRFSGEFPGGLPGNGGPKTETTRRDFLALMGFSVAMAGLSGCRAPVQHAIPMLVGSDQIIPGVSSYYATTCRGCASSCSLLVKQRDGRPIKIEGNSESALFGNGTCAGGQATVLSLYDDERLKAPMWRGNRAAWEEIDQRVRAALDEARSLGRDVALLSGTITSPSTRAMIADWGRRMPGFRHVEYDAVSLSAMRQANRESFGEAVVPHYLFDRAKVIVGMEADFLGTWLSPVEFTRQYAAGRRREEQPVLHIQFESGFSVTGSNADLRVSLPPSQIGPVAAALLQRIAKKAGEPVPAFEAAAVDSARLDAVAGELWKHRGQSLVVSGVNEVAVQVMVNAMNALLGNIGRTIDLDRPSRQRGGDDAAVAQLLKDMQAGKIHTLIMYGVNPVYDYAYPKEFSEALKKVTLSISLADRLDETGSLADAVCPDHHFLEAWGDAEPVISHFSLAQPLIAPLFETRAAQESFLRWMGADGPHANYYAYLREFWRKEIFPRQKDIQSFDEFWDRSLQQGTISLPATGAVSSKNLHGGWKETLRAITEQNVKSASTGEVNAFELHFYESVALRDGRQANNPWLQELPDPVSKVCWGNYAAIAPAVAARLSLEDGDVAAIRTGEGQIIELPVFIQPGQDAGTISIAMGHGRTKAGKAANDVGVNAFPLTSIVDGARRYSVPHATLTRTGRKESLATTQADFSMEGRPIVLETTLEELRREAEKGGENETLPTLWAERLQGDHAWGMAIDMNACTGCSACVVACQAENNVPVVGKDQIERIRIMHWIRIDRYYSGPEENPVSVHQPMMCQHCQNAPCETVCPVLATTTSSEGLNQQVYNRCIGTRYCANNCPYKVRRFNWYNYTENPAFDFNMESPLGRMALNPDVVVRSRGVMEKCSLCVQRIQLAKNLALQGRRPLAEGDIQTACQQACPAQAIVFGDLKDPNSRVSQLQRSQRRYQVLEDVGTRPNVAYLKRIRNPMEQS